VAAVAVVSGVVAAKILLKVGDTQNLFCSYHYPGIIILKLSNISISFRLELTGSSAFNRENLS
jgi:hypothetical protein